MNLAQTIFLKAREAAASLSGDFTPHDLDTKRLELFKAQGMDPADYSEWSNAFANRRRDLLAQANLERTTLERLSHAKAASELKPATLAPPPAPVPPTLGAAPEAPAPPTPPTVS